MWREIGFPVPPPGAPAGLEVVEDATLTTFDKGRIPVAPKQRPDWFVTGAVYDAGHLVPRSQRIGGLSNDHALSFDPPELPLYDGRVERLSGTWLYGGTWFNHFGHFLTETLTSLWPREAVDGVVFHQFWFGGEVHDYQREALRLLGRSQRPVVVGTERVRVERLLVPDRAYLPNGYAAPEALAVFDRLRDAAVQELSEAGAAAGRAPAVGTHDRVFLSRTAHHDKLAAAGTPSRRSVANEAAVDELAARLGFHVVAAEQLSLSEQVALAAGASVLSGPSGSALHLSVFAGPDATVIELADRRDWSKPVLTQQILCHARGQRLGFVSLNPGPEGRRLDVLEERLAALLTDDAPGPGQKPRHTNGSPGFLGRLRS